MCADGFKLSLMEAGPYSAGWVRILHAEMRGQYDRLGNESNSNCRWVNIAESPNPYIPEQSTDCFVRFADSKYQKLESLGMHDLRTESYLLYRNKHVPLEHLRWSYPARVTMMNAHTK